MNNNLRMTTFFAERTRLNVHCLVAKTTAAFVRILPFRVQIIELIGLVRGTMLMLFEIGQWGRIARFARASESTVSGWAFIVRHYIRRGEDCTWTNLYYEMPAVLGKHIDVERCETLEQALRDGKGAVLLGVHGGPSICSHLLLEMNVNIKCLVAEGTFRLWERATRYVIRPILSKRIAFLSDPRRNIIAGKSEREIVRHMKDGGAIFMMIDSPSVFAKEKVEGAHVHAMGMTFQPHYFPFRLSLRYGSPVYFCFFQKVPRGYRLRFAHCGAFSTPHEGFLNYLSFLQGQVTAQFLHIAS